MELDANFKTSSPILLARPQIGAVQTIHGKDGKDGESAYKIAVRNGFEGTEAEWLKSLHGQNGDKGDPFTYEDFTEEQLAALKGADGYTPVRGTDYWTEEDKKEIVSDTLDQIIGEGGGGTGVPSLFEKVNALDEQVTLNTSDIATLMAWKAEKEYVNISVSAGHNRTGAVEKGTVFNDVTVSWDVSRVPTSLTISGDGITGTENLPLAKSGSKTITGLNINADNASTFDWTVKATGEKETDVATAKVSGFSFRTRVYYGSADLPTTINSDFVKSLTASGLVASKVKSIEVNGDEKYIWYCLPKSMGSCSFMSNNFPFDMQEPQTVSVTNDLGYTETYYVYRSTNQIDVTMKIEVS